MQRRYFLIVLLSFLLSACALHFRNASDVPPGLKVLAINNTNTKSNLTSELAANLKDLGVNIVNPSQKAPVTLYITNDSFSQSTSLLGTAQQLNNVYINYTVTYVLQNSQGQNITEPATVTSSTTYLENANQLLGDTVAIPQIQQSLVHDMTSRILAKLSSQQTAQALAKAS